MEKNPALNPSVLQNPKEFFWHDHEEPASKELPFVNYMKQALFGVADGVVEAARGYEELAFQKPGTELPVVATADFETHLLLYMAAGISSNVTKAATTLFQMQF